MLRTAGALVVGVAEVPGLPRPDQPADEHAVDPFSTQTARATRAADGPRRNESRQSAATLAMNRVRIHRFVPGRRRSTLTTLGAKPLMGGMRQELPAALIAPAHAERLPATWSSSPAPTLAA
jgi:hypothetical protein